MAFTWSRDGVAVHAFAAIPPAENDPVRRTKLAGLLVASYDYLRKNGPTHPALATAVTELTSAVGAYQAQNNDATIGGIRRTLAAINDVRRSDPSLPVL